MTHSCTQMTCHCAHLAMTLVMVSLVAGSPLCAPLRLFDIGVADQFVLFSRDAVDSVGAAKAVWGHSAGMVTNGISVSASQGIKFLPTHALVSEANLALTAYIHQMTAGDRPLNDLTCNPRSPFPVGGVTSTPLLPGVYSHAGALALAGTTVFDAQNRSDATFVVMTGGALSVAATANLVLLNGAQTRQILWHVDGAMTTAAGTRYGGMIFSVGATAMGANTVYDGAIVSQGAIALGAGCILTRRALAVGAVAIDGGTINGPATAVKISMTRQPALSVSLLPLHNAPWVEILNEFGHRRRSDEVEVTVRISSFSGETPTLFGTTIVTTSSGRGQFPQIDE
jgi:hypothetical protein